MKKNLFNNLSVATKLFIGLLLVLILLISFGSYLVNSLSKLGTSFRRTRDQYDVLSAISTIELTNTRLSDATKYYLSTGDEKWESIYYESLTSFNNALVRLTTFERDIEDFNTIDKLRDLSKELRTTESQVFSRVQTENFEESVELFDAKYKEKSDEISSIVTKYLERELKEMTATLQKSDEAIAYTRTSIIFLLTVCAVIGIGSLIFVLLSVSRPINRLTKTVGQISAGDLNIKAKVTSNDEVGRLALAFNKMTKNLKKTLQELEREKARLLASIKSSPIGFGVIGKAGRIVVSNSVFRKLLSDCKNLQDIHNKLRKSVNFYDKYEDAVNKNRTTELKDIGINDRFLRIIISPTIKTNDHKQVIGAVLLVEDVTEAKLLERSKNEFFAVASHEMRTPLTAIKSNASFFKDQYLKDIKNKDAIEVLNDIHNSSVSLLNTVDNFLSTSRLEMGEMEFDKEKFDLSAVIKRATEEVKILADKKNLYIKIESPRQVPQVSADEQKTKEIIYNLLSNAINYTEKGGVTIKMTINHNNMKVRFIDTGVGISTQNQKLLFQKFQQAGENILTKEKGSSVGLGLYISRLLARGMKGEVTLEKSKLGGGSTFVFTIPLAKET